MLNQEKIFCKYKVVVLMIDDEDNYHYDNNETNDNSNVPTNDDNSNNKTNDNDVEDFNEENEHECKVASQIGTQDLLDYPNLHPEFRDSGMYHVIYNMKKVNRGVI